MRELFTILIQGQLNKYTLDMVDEYSRQAHLVLSYWNTDDTELKNSIRKKKFDAVVENEMFDRWRPSERGYYKYQTTTTYEGLKQVKTKYVIKLRSDEVYPNMLPFMENIRNNPYRFTSINFYFRRSTDNPEFNNHDHPMKNQHFVNFHPSDHLFGGRTDLMLKTFELMDRSYSDENLNKKIYHKTAETAFATCFLLAKGIQPDFNNVSKQMHDHFSVVPVEKMGDVRIVNRRRGKEFKIEDVYNIQMPTFSIRYMDEL